MNNAITSLVDEELEGRIDLSEIIAAGGNFARNGQSAFLIS